MAQLEGFFLPGRQLPNRNRLQRFLTDQNFQGSRGDCLRACVLDGNTNGRLSICSHDLSGKTNPGNRHVPQGTGRRKTSYQQLGRPRQALHRITK